ncbi:MAG: alpha-2-macroglobulin family protein [Candidatus Spyradosoma sp.]
MKFLKRIPFALFAALAPFGVAAEPAPATAPEPASAPAAVPPLSVTDFSFDAPSRRADLRFSDAVDPEALRRALKIVPAVDFKLVPRGDALVGVFADYAPGSSYEISVSGELAGKLAAPSGKSRTFSFSMPDLPEIFAFVSSGRFVAPSAPDFALPLQLRNVARVSIETREVYPDRIADFVERPASWECSRPIFNESVRPKITRNRAEVFSLELEKIGIARRPGLYLVEAGDSDSYWRRERRIVVVTDLVIQAARNGDEVAVVVKNISGNAPVAGAKVSVFSRKKRWVADTKTDAGGFVKLTLPELADREDSPWLILAELDGDRTFLSLRSLWARRGGRGFERPGAKAYVFPERGVCRPGETMRIYASLRDGADKRASAGVPAEFEVRAPDGNRFGGALAVGDEFGFYRTEIEIPAFAATGTYRVSMGIPGQTEQAFGSARFGVADYVPDTFSLSLASTREDGRTRVSGNAAYYFGAPLADGDVTLERETFFADFAPRNPEFAGFEFGARMPDEPKRDDAPVKARTDAAGAFSVVFDDPKLSAAATQPLVSRVTVSASSGAGSRAVSAKTSVKIHYADFYFGTREAAVEPARRVFEVCALSPDEKRVAPTGAKFRAALTRCEWDYVVRENAEGVASCEWQRVDSPAGEVAFDDSAREIAVPVPSSGSYLLEIFDEAGTRLHAREFCHWFGETGARSADFSDLAFTFDAERYAPGATAKIAFESPFSGSAVLLFGSEKIEGARVFPVVPGKNEFELAVPEDTSLGSRFFAVTACGKLPALGFEKGEETRRLFGVGALPVDQRARLIRVKACVPAVARPGEKVPVRVELADADGKPLAGRVQIWAVDRGVLSLDAFRTPDAFSYFFGTYDCPYAFGDGYGSFYPVLAKGESLIGGGAALSRKFLGEDEEAKLSAVAVAEPIDVPAEGFAETTLALPDFDGGMRLMAFALDAERTGSAEANFVVRSPVSVKMTTPRALAPGDEFDAVAEIFNSDLPDGELSWRLLVNGAEKASGSFGAVKRGEKRVARERLKADAACGAGSIAFEVLDADGRVVSSEKLGLRVRAPIPAVDRVAVTKLEPGAEAAFANASAFGEVSVGTPALAVAGALEWLGAYPYGCLEQTAAAAFPLLATQALVRAGVVSDGFAETSSAKVRAALARIATMRCRGGAYAMWPGSSEPWDAGTLFACHFELEAATAGFALSAQRRAELSSLLFGRATDTRSPLAERAYALYLAASAGNGRAAEAAKALAREAETAGDAFSRLLAGAASVKSGYAAEGAKEIAAAADVAAITRAPGSGATCIDSPVRRAGVALRLLCEIAPGDAACPKLARFLVENMRASGYWGTTQANAWAAFGLAAFLAADGGAGTESARVFVAGEEKPFAASMKIAGGSPVVVKNTGTRPLYVFERTRETPERAENVAAGFTVSREYLDARGEPVTSCAAGDLLTVRVRVRADVACESAVICDLLPGGLEIEDETLATRAAVNARGAEEKTSGFHERARERRYDRFLAFGAFSPTSGENRETTLLYRVRATTRGVFAVPPVQVESMYDADCRGTGAPAVPVFEVK